MTRKPLLFAAGALVAGAFATTSSAATTSVKVGDNYFIKKKGVPSLSVSQGSRLRFSFVGGRDHNVRGVKIKLGASCREARESGSCTTRKLRKTGTFTLFCELHGADDQKMRLTVF